MTYQNPFQIEKEKARDAACWYNNGSEVKITFPRVYSPWICSSDMVEVPMRGGNRFLGELMGQTSGESKARPTVQELGREEEMYAC